MPKALDPRHIVRDVTEDLFHAGFIGCVRWLSIERNRAWAEEFAQGALQGRVIADSDSSDWAITYEAWRQGVGGSERLAWTLDTVPDPYVGLHWQHDGKIRVINTIQGDKAYIETEGTRFAAVMDLADVRGEIARNIHRAYSTRYEEEGAKFASPPAPKPAPVADYPWAKTELERGRIKKIMESRIRHEGQVATTQEYLDKLLSRDAHLYIVFAPSSLSRAAYNRQDNNEQAAWARKQVEQGLKPSYELRVGDVIYTVNATEFEYAYQTAGRPPVTLKFSRGYLDERSFPAAKAAAERKHARWFALGIQHVNEREQPAPTPAPPAQAPAPSRPRFNVGDTLTHTNRYGDEMTVNFRGRHEGDRAVVVSLDGMQFVVPLSELSGPATSPVAVTGVVSRPAPAIPPVTQEAGEEARLVQATDARRRGDDAFDAPEYRYGLQNRPAGFGSVPKGYLRVDPKDSLYPDRTRHGVVVYPLRLSDKLVKDYELAPFLPSRAVSKVLYDRFRESVTDAEEERSIVEDMRDDRRFGFQGLAAYADDMGRFFSDASSQQIVDQALDRLIEDVLGAAPAASAPAPAGIDPATIAAAFKAAAQAALRDLE